MSNPYFDPAPTGDQIPGQAVAFGPKPYQTITPEVASMILTLWRERSPAVFGAYLAEAMTETAPQTHRRSRADGRA